MPATPRAASQIVSLFGHVVDSCAQGEYEIEVQILRARSPVAQSVEQTAVNRRVAGSNPARGANFSARHF